MSDDEGGARRRAVEARLAAGGFLAADEEAGELLDAAAGDDVCLAEFLERRLTGEPLAWITGQTVFAGEIVRVERGVYVPRAHSEALVWRALERFPDEGIAIDCCTGSGALALVLQRSRPRARVLACDLDERAVACAASNGLEVVQSDGCASVPAALLGRVDVLVAVAPYVPSTALGLLQRDTFAFESPVAYDGGADGTVLLRRIVRDGARVLRRGAALLLELGGAQADLLAGDLDRLGYGDVEVVYDEEADVRGIEATFLGPR